MDIDNDGKQSNKIHVNADTNSNKANQNPIDKLP